MSKVIDRPSKGKNKNKNKKSNSKIEDSAKSFVDKLFGVNNDLKLDELPDDYDPLDVIANDDFNLMDLVSKSIDPVTGIPLDVRLPEGDFREAANFFEFCDEFRGKDAKFPFPRQIWACTHLLAEWCPKCSHPRWHDFDRVPVNSSRDAIRERVVFLEFGVCPHCGSTKHDLIKDGLLNNYSEAAWMWGQRAGKSTTVGSITEYIAHKYLKFPKLSSICEGISSSTPLSGTFVGLRFADAFSLLWDPISKGIMSNPWFCLAEGTTIALADGTEKTIETMSAGDQVKTLEGQNEVLRVFDNGVQECFTLETEGGQSLTGTEPHQVRGLSSDGLSLVWKAIGDITEDDYVLESALTTVNCREVVIDGKRLTFSKVKSKTPVGKKHVYDFEVKDVHNYYANGINVHNCDYHAMLDDYGKRLGIEFYRSKDQYLKYMHKNIEFYPAGPSKRALRGRTRILTGTDELGWFPVGLTEGENEDRERADADEVHHALDRSLLTVRTEVSKLLSKGYNNFINGIAINISSPSDENDKISRLVKENVGSRKVLGVQAATWNISPFYTRENEEIAEAFRKNPEEAARDYGAIPPSNARQFIVPAQVLPSFKIKNRAVLEKEDKEIGDRMRRAGFISSTNPVQPMPPSIMSIDAGYSNNAFAITILNLTQVKIGIGEFAQQFKAVEVPVLLEIQPENGVTLHYNRIYQRVLKPLISAFNVRGLFADRWNSIALLDQAGEDFEAKQLMAKQYSVKYKDFLLVRSYMQEEKLWLPELELPAEELAKGVSNYPFCFSGKPAAHLYFQVGKVRDVGSTVTKGSVYTDDLFRSLTLGVSRILDLKVQEHLEKFMHESTRGPAIGAISAGRLMGLNRPMNIGMPTQHGSVLVTRSGSQPGGNQLHGLGNGSNQSAILDANGNPRRSVVVLRSRL